MKSSDWAAMLGTIAGIMVIAGAVGAFAFWRENRNRNVGIASYILGLGVTVAASMKLGLLAVMAYAGVYLLHRATVNVTTTIQLTLLFLGSLAGLQHVRVQAERSRQERDDWTDAMQEAWTKNITAAIAAKDQSIRKEAADEARRLYRRCRIRMNNDASLLLSRAMTIMSALSDPDAQPEHGIQARKWLRGLIVPTRIEEPRTTTILELFRAYRNGGPIGWYTTRMLTRYVEAPVPGMIVAKTGLVEDEDTLM